MFVGRFWLLSRKSFKGSKNSMCKCATGRKTNLYEKSPSIRESKEVKKSMGGPDNVGCNKYMQDGVNKCGTGKVRKFI